MPAVEYNAHPFPCVHCGEPTAPGFGRFVNRVPASGEFELDDGTIEQRDGYACEECTEPIAYAVCVPGQAMRHMCEECAYAVSEERGEYGMYFISEEDCVQPIFADERDTLPPGTISCAECEASLA